MSHGVVYEFHSDNDNEMIPPIMITVQLILTSNYKTLERREHPNSFFTFDLQ